MSPVYNYDSPLPTKKRNHSLTPPGAPQVTRTRAIPNAYPVNQPGTGGVPPFMRGYTSVQTTPEKREDTPTADTAAGNPATTPDYPATNRTLDMGGDAIQVGDGGHFGDTHAEPPSPVDTVIIESQMVEMPAYFSESSETDKDDVNDDGYLTADVSDGGYTVRPRTGNIWSDDRLERFFLGRQDQGKPVRHRAADLPASASTSLYNSLCSSREAGSDGDDEEEDGVDQFLPSNADVPRTP